MIVYTAYTRPAFPPVLVPERFAWGALLFGPLWLAWHRAWVPAALAAFVDATVTALTPEIVATVLSTALAVLLGLLGQDLRRWSLERRGFALVHVVGATDADSALARLLQRRPDLIGPSMALEVTP